MSKSKDDFDWLIPHIKRLFHWDDIYVDENKVVCSYHSNTRFVHAGLYRPTSGWFSDGMTICVAQYVDGKYTNIEKNVKTEAQGKRFLSTIQL